MHIFNRLNFTELWVTITAGESLGILNTSYIEDYFGIEGQLTLRSMENDTRISFSVAEDIDATPSINHDVFTGFIDLSSIDDGVYRVEGRVRDAIGNYRILSEVQSPFGTEDVTLFEIEISPLTIVVKISIESDVLFLEKPQLDLVLLEKPSTDVVWLDNNIFCDLAVLLKPESDLQLDIKPSCDLFIDSIMELDILNVYTKANAGI